MTSRLDRLFILLESGSTAATRHAAAKQIGEVQKLYPHELHTLLNRLVGYLHSSSWETRIAAAQSVEAILKQVPPWQPELQLGAINLKKERQGSDATEEDSCQSNASSSTTTTPCNERLLSFDEFDLQQILQKGARLIGSEGNEFDVQEEQPASGGGVEEQSVAARLIRQRALLNDKLGLTAAAKLGVNLTDMITDEDVALTRSGTSYNVNAEKLPVEHILNIKPAAANGGATASACATATGQKLSCREMNRAKRKARQGSSTGAASASAVAVSVTPTCSRRNSTAGIAAAGSNSNSSGSSCTGSNSNGASTVDEPEKKKLKANDTHEIFYSLNTAVPDATGTWVDAVSWPLENFCARLFIDLFHAKWEVRHGAATALRELINQHGTGAGKCGYQSVEQMHEAHSRWLEDAALRLLCVLCLDRFGDFVSDQVVAPVRETCAQVLGTLVKAIDESKVHRIVDILLQLIRHKNEWEVRHGGLLGLKYVFVVREELLSIYLPKSISDILLGLLDVVDDVGAVAAATLIPVAKWLPKLLNATQVSSIVKMLWDLLLDQDELTSACNSFMGLLAAILCLPMAASWIQMEPIGTLVPRLFPFLSHSTSSVRRSTLKTLLTLTSSGESSLVKQKPENGKPETPEMKLNFGVVDWNWQLLQQALRHIYQRMLVEPQADIQALAHQVWSNIIQYADLGALLHAACPHVSTWICLAMQPPRLAFDPAVLIRAIAGSDVASSTAAGAARRRTPRMGDDLGGAALAHSNAMQKLYLGGSEATPLEIREANFMRARITASRAMGALSHYLVQPAPGVLYTPQVESPTDCYTKVLLGHLNARSAVQRIVCGLIIAFWALEDEPVRPGPPNLQEKLHQCMSESFYYDELAMSLTRLLQEALDFIATLKQNKIPINDFNNAKVLTLEQIDAVATTLSDNLRSHALKPKVLDMLLERRRSLQASYQQTTGEQFAYHVSAQAAMAGAICALHCLPDKLNPVVKPLMESIKREQCVPLQQLSADFLVHLMDQVCDRNPSPNNKILNNLCTLLRSDAEHTPKLNMPTQTLLETRPNDSNASEYYGILTLTLSLNPPSGHSNTTGSSKRAGATTPSTTTAPRGPGRPPASEALAVAAAAAACIEASTQQAKEAEARQCRTQRLGAACAIAKLCSTFGERMVDKVPIFQQLMFGKLQQFVASVDADTLISTLPDLTACNELISSLQLIETAAPHLHAALHPQLFALLPQLGCIVRHPLKVLRHMSARCIAALADIDTCRTMQFVVTELLELLLKVERPIERQGAVEAIERVVNRLQIRVVPYIVLLVVPLLGSMSDADESVRLLATHSFATLVQLMPLDNSSASNSKSGVKTEGEIKNEPLEERKTRDREFLDYLFKPKTIPDYHVPVSLSVELRGYQQAGINWLWFLNKYNLHGILCDDMGLGKTLQTICILAGDHLQRQEAQQASLPSLVICPPTLTGHWVYEVDKFLSQSPSPVLRPLHYFGFPVGREKLRSQIGTSCNLVVASYDTIRKDIDYFSGIHFNYCVLDEGHIIKNGKTKSSKAIKQLKANHRLILSGTPIQNNVLELWSLFDFLMPGFLGTEKQFIQRYSRPILASRDAKSSAKDQEAGVLAMEALHRQVLPFLLRRVKEDVLTDLPPKITQDLLCELSPLQLRLYEDFSNKHLKDCLNKLDDTENLGSKTHIFQALRYLQNVCNHPKLVLRQSNDERVNIAAQLALSHSSLDDIEHSAKLPALKQLLLDCGIGVQTESVSQHRALIFCQLKAMLDIVEHDLLRKHLPSVTYLRLDGSVPASLRQDIVNNFNSDPSIDVLLLTTQVGGLGLNLTGADTVIFVEHDWNPMKDLQAMDRAHRIGQKKVVNVYRLITRNSLEEKIMSLQKFKILTANTVVSAENASLQTMGTPQILDLFQSGNDNKAQSSGTAAIAAGSGGMSMNTIIENLPDLWSEYQYEEEYDLGNFVQALKK
ncbi:LOW QUALITY PROTEIN: TATA-binding protein-associated factor 172 [Drosophila sulfurigaster albostrigata]|uniref:LOW QUALITY PROTEIN: TATA-binding protein-associated factor 172 n=1 Tax=Drosophila sulfurigaster albostrigata TaxID=89887 RepID=UPI002D2191AE|nr:LOW QUALITY PROTEIN: TATA-binding protein-associated factor 172 [Drosophila sulfurigaster albostrigata]